MSILDFLTVDTTALKDKDVKEHFEQFKSILNTLLQFIHIGSGSPENNEIGSVGHVFFRSDGGASTTLYVKESGTAKTGWIAK